MFGQPRTSWSWVGSSLDPAWYAAERNDGLCAGPIAPPTGDWSCLETRVNRGGRANDDEGDEKANGAGAGAGAGSAPRVEAGGEARGEVGGGSGDGAGELANESAGRRRHVVIYLRDRSRRVIGAEDFVAALRLALGGAWAVSVIHHSDDESGGGGGGGVSSSSPCALSRCLAAADVLVTVHGFQSILGTWLRPGATFVEVFPAGFHIAMYSLYAYQFGARYVPLTGLPVTAARRALINAVSPRRCMKHYLCRRSLRDGDVALGESHVRAVAAAARWSAGLCGDSGGGEGEGWRNRTDDCPALRTVRVPAESHYDCVYKCSYPHGHGNGVEHASRPSLYGDRGGGTCRGTGWTVKVEEDWAAAAAEQEVGGGSGGGEGVRFGDRFSGDESCEHLVG